MLRKESKDCRIKQLHEEMSVLMKKMENASAAEWVELQEKLKECQRKLDVLQCMWG